MYEKEPEHPMEHQYASYQNTMDNAQKAAPSDPYKKTGKCADYYNGTTEAEEDSMESMMGLE